MIAGNTLSGYKLKESKGIGANGEVWLAEKGDVKYALKILLNKDGNGIDKDKYDKEVNSWQKASGHKNILTIYEHFIKNGKYVIVMDYADGGSLKYKEFSHNEAIKICIQILHGLKHLHQLNIAHRDIKPDNILLKNEVPCLGDFGLARDLDRTQSTQIIGGSENYFSPELANAYISRKANDKSNYPRTFGDDLWALATTFYNLITKDFPCGGLGNRAEREFLPEDFPDDLIDFFDKSFQKEKTDRFQSAEEMLDALEAIARQRFEKEQLEIARQKAEREFQQKYEEELTILQEMNKNLLDQISILDKQIDSSRNKVKDFENEIKSKDEEILQLGKKISSLSSQSYLEKEKQKLEDKYRQQFKEEKDVLEKEVRKLTKEISDFQNQVDIAGEELYKARDIIGNLENEKQVKIKETVVLKADFQNNFSKINKELADLNKKNLDLNLSLSDRDAQISKLKAEKDTTGKIISFGGLFSILGKVFALLAVFGTSIVAYYLFQPSYYVLAANCEEKKDFDCAMLNYSNAIKEDPENSTYYVKIGDIFRFKGKEKNQDRAIEFYNKAIAFNPNNSDAYFGLGYSYEVKNEYEEAIKNYERYVKLTPNPAAYNILAAIYSNEKYEKRDYDKAVELYNKAIELEPKNANTYIKLADIYTYKAKNKNQDKAIELYKQAIALGSKDSDAYYGLGYSFYEKGSFDEAIKNYEECAKLGGNPYNNLGLIYANEKYNKKNYDKAVEHFNKSLNLDSGDPLPYYNLGIVYKKKKDYQKAIDNYKLYLEKTKDNNEKDTVLNKEDATKRIKELESLLAKQKLEDLQRISNFLRMNSNGYSFGGLNSNSKP
jgi:serine/threonine protein kinase